VPIRPAQTPEAQQQRWAELRSQIGGRIRELRIAGRLTQESLALEAGMSRNMVIGLEWGRKSVAYERLWDIAGALGVEVEELLKPPVGSPRFEPYRGGSRPRRPQ
jgi:transcriptional regulator with XRE-family HTH domain